MVGPHSLLAHVQVRAMCQCSVLGARIRSQSSRDIGRNAMYLGCIRQQTSDVSSKFQTQRNPSRHCLLTQVKFPGPCSQPCGSPQERTWCMTCLLNCMAARGLRNGQPNLACMITLMFFQLYACCPHHQGLLRTSRLLACQRQATPRARRHHALTRKSLWMFTPIKSRAR